jgi:cytochrome c peroxidase
MPPKVIKRFRLVGLVAVFCGLPGVVFWWSLMSGAGGRADAAQKPPAAVLARRPATLVPLPQSLEPAKPAMVELGRRLFHDVRLSRDNTVSCASCHVLDKGGVDRRRTAVGVDGRVGDANAPTVFNAALNFRQFWDGRAATLEDQAAGPVHNPIEMDSNWPQVLGKLAGDQTYQRLAREAFAQPLSGELIARAIAAFERTLITADAPFDRFLRGEEAALSPKARQGYRLFLELGCIACHQGVNVGGNLYANLGVMGDFFAGRAIKKIDLGRYNITNLEDDRHKFKVPSLRNVGVTEPYFHDGSVATLDEAVEIMARFQLGLEIGHDDRDAVVAFLQSLTGPSATGAK